MLGNHDGNRKVLGSCANLAGWPPVNARVHAVILSGGWICSAFKL